MLVIVPHAGQFESVMTNLTWEDISGASFRDTQVSLAMPKFEFRTSASLAPVLAQLGMETAFDARNADFSGMTGATDLFLSDVVHEAFISVDEVGTEAAAATGSIMQVVSMPALAELVIDRPFLFFIMEHSTGAALFLGMVMDPAAH